MNTPTIADLLSSAQRLVDAGADVRAVETHATPLDGTALTVEVADERSLLIAADLLRRRIVVDDFAGTPPAVTSAAGDALLVVWTPHDRVQTLCAA